MNNSKSRLLVTALALAVTASACGKKEENQPAPAPAPEAKPAVEPAAAPPAPPAAAPAAEADYVKLMATHSPVTEADPVTISVEKFTVKSATFDPANLEGATAELELDLSSIKSDKDKRDQHLQSPDYLDVAKFATAMVKISGVKKEGEKDYAASAEVSARGVTKTYPVKFTVLESSADSVKVKAEHKFDRLEFGIGKEPDGVNEKTAKELTIQVQLTLKKS